MLALHTLGDTCDECDNDVTHLNSLKGHILSMNVVSISVMNVDVKQF